MEITDLVSSLTFPQKKQALLDGVSVLATDQINKYYPPYKQLNIGRLGKGYTVLDQAKMAAFIDNIRDVANDFEAQINAAQNEAALAGKKFEFSSYSP